MQKRRTAKTKKEVSFEGKIGLFVFFAIMSRFFFDDFYNYLYNEHFWRWWLGGYIVMSIVQFGLAAVGLVLYLKGMSVVHKVKKISIKSTLVGYAIIIGLVVVIYSLGQTTIQAFGEYFITPVSEIGICNVTYKDHRRSADEYYLNILRADGSSSSALRLTKWQFDAITTIDHESDNIPCRGEVEVTYLPHFMWLTRMNIL